jgi:outer membrane biosynthesis protein TonB
MMSAEKIRRYSLLLHGMAIFTTLSRTSPKTRTRNRTVVGVSLSVLIHVLLFFVLRPSLQKIQPQASSSHEPLEVTFVQSPPKQAARQPDQPQKAKPVKKPAPQPKQIARAKSSPSAPAVRQAPPVSNSPTAITQAQPEMDMSTMLNAARERRRSSEDSAARENAAARAAEQGPSANEIAQANIDFQARKASGPSNGMFEIVSKGPRIAQYLFYGWTKDARNKSRRTITVDAGLNGDMDKAIVDSMIAIIRQNVTGDFTFDSQRLGRVVTLSARMQDNAGLQAFLLREFFG